MRVRTERGARAFAKRIGEDWFLVAEACGVETKFHKIVEQGNDERVLWDIFLEIPKTSSLSKKILTKVIDSKRDLDSLVSFLFKIPAEFTNEIEYGCKKILSKTSWAKEKSCAIVRVLLGPDSQVWQEAFKIVMKEEGALKTISSYLGSAGGMNRDSMETIVRVALETKLPQDAQEFLISRYRGELQGKLCLDYLSKNKNQVARKFVLHNLPETSNVRPGILREYISRV